MIRFGRILAGAAVLAVSSSAVIAADVMPVIPSVPPVVVQPPVPAFDWSGVYAGTRGQLLFCSGPCWANIEGHAGYNFVAGRFLAGVEVGAGYWTEFGAGGWTANVAARSGVVLGRALAYARVGYAAYEAGGVYSYVTVAGGAELAIGRSLSIFAEVAAERYLGGMGVFYGGVAAGVNFHFGH